MSEYKPVIERTRIPLTVATERAKAWRELLGSVPVSGVNGEASVPAKPLVPPQRIFRAININMDDIKQLIEDQPDAKSVRVYLSLPNPAYPYQICGLIVPVDQNNNDMLFIEGHGLSKEEAIKTSKISTIYDFTTPCPNLCDTDSPLFNELNDPEGYL